MLEVSGALDQGSMKDGSRPSVDHFMNAETPSPLTRAILGRVVSMILALIATAFTVQAESRPHLIIYLGDDHGIDFVGCYGNPAVKTPNLDKLATEGCRFTGVFAASPTCSPSRAVLWTGLHSARNGTMGNHTDCKPDLSTLPHHLKKLGYRVVAANKTDVRPASIFPWEVLKATLPKNPAHARKYRAEGLDTAAVDRFLEEHTRTQPNTPLCLILGDNNPHVTWEPNRDFDPAALPLPPFLVDTPKTRTALANYFQDIATLDQRVGDVMKSLAKHGLAEKSLFIYTADQGPEWPHCKWTCYDTGLHVPFIARWPGKIQPGSTSQALISFVDVTPTLVDLAGGPALPQLDGRSFKEVLMGKATKHRHEIFASHTGDGEMNRCPQRGVRDARYKFILNLHPERKWTTHFTLVDGIPYSHRDVYSSWLDKAAKDEATAKFISLIENHPAEELYDVQADPYELNNLAADPQHQRVLSAMRDKLHVWRDAVGDRSL